MKYNYALLSALILFLLPSCSGNKEKEVTVQEIKNTEEALVGANRLLVQKDHEKIVSYNKQHNLVMKETASGLWYNIQSKGNGQKAKEDMTALLNYKVSLLDGTVCYNSDSLGPKRFRIGKGGVESGLEEGVLLLKEGDKATFIMPPHLAHGLPGDGNKIPARAIIVYEVELFKLDP